MNDCIFCKIVNGDIPSEIVYEDDAVIVFKDINPQAPVHVLVIPRKHIPTIYDLKGEDYNLVGHIFQVVNKLVDKFGLEKDGFRVVTNCRERAGQSVFHIHFHLLGGRDLEWPPG